MWVLPLLAASLYEVVAPNITHCLAKGILDKFLLLSGNAALWDELKNARFEGMGQFLIGGCVFGRRDDSATQGNTAVNAPERSVNPIMEVFIKSRQELDLDALFGEGHQQATFHDATIHRTLSSGSCRNLKYWNKGRQNLRFSAPKASATSIKVCGEEPRTTTTI